MNPSSPGTAQHYRVGGVRRPERTTPDGLIEALTELSSRCRALTARNRELASEVEEVRVERRRLERGLHDGVENEVVSLLVGLRLTAGDRHKLPELAVKLSAPGARADDAEVAAYVSCSEASQNVARHAGRVAHATLRLNYDRGARRRHPGRPPRLRHRTNRRTRRREKTYASVSGRLAGPSSSPQIPDAAPS
jgi:hypothetical protein